MRYLSETERVLCPVTFIATLSGTPKLTMFLTAVHESHVNIPGHPPSGRLSPGLLKS
jgi:hypothetical protein